MVPSSKTSLVSVFLAAGLVLSFNAVAQSPAAPASVRCTVTLPPAQTDADRAFNSGNFSAAEGLFASQVASTGGSGAYSGLVRSELQQEKLDAALANANKAVSAFPNSPESHTVLGESLERSGQIPEASAEYTRALTLDHCFARAHYGAGNLFNLALQHATAAREYSIAHQLSPRDIDISLAYLSSLPASRRAAAIRQFLNQTTPEVVGIFPDRRHELEVEAAILEAGKTCHVSAIGDKATLELKPLMYDGIRIRDWGLDARINDRSNFLLELDTTVPGVVLSRSAAVKAGVAPIIKGDDAAAAGYMAYADNIKIGKLELQACPVRVVNDNTLAGGNSLISPELFADHAININFAARTLTLSPLPPLPPAPPAAAADAPTDRYIAPEMKDWSRVYLAGGRILMATAINKSKGYLFMLDTGAPITIVAPSTASKVLSLKPDTSVPYRGVSSDILKIYEKAQGASIDVADIYDGSGKLLKVSKPFKTPIFEFARLSRLDDEAQSFDMTQVSHAAGVEVSGLVGFSILKDLFINIDYRDGLVDLVFDSNYTYRSRERTY